VWQEDVINSRELKRRSHGDSEAVSVAKQVQLDIKAVKRRLGYLTLMAFVFGQFYRTWNNGENCKLKI
jgi:hypothetical protein